jgi:hypothetical protein
MESIDINHYMDIVESEQSEVSDGAMEENT